MYTHQFLATLSNQNPFKGEVIKSRGAFQGTSDLARKFIEA
jgi:hypothetical protein